MATELSDYGDPYVELRDGTLYVRRTRVQFESVLRLWLEGRRPEEIQQDYQHVPLAAVYGAIAFYLTHRQEMETFFAENDARFAAQKRAVEACDPERYAALRRRFAAAAQQRAPDETSGVEEHFSLA